MAEKRKADDHAYDVVVVGGGSGGVRCSRTCAGLGLSAAVVELPYGEVSTGGAKGGLGGTCVLRGCVPKKLLMYGSAFSAELEDAAGFGWDLAGKVPASVTWDTLRGKKSSEVKRLNGVYGRLLDGAGVTSYVGSGRLLGDGAVEVTAPDGTKTTLTAKHVVVATGGYATKPDVPGKELAITSDEALALDELPGRLAVVGGGYIAVEFAQIFKGLGSDVTLAYRQPQVLRGFDQEVRDTVMENLASRGVNMCASASPTAVERAADGKSLVLKLSDGSSIEADVVLFATGRAPNTKRPDLGLEAVGVELQPRSGAIKVDELSRTNVPGVYAIGDVTDRINLTPVALHEGMLLARTLASGTPHVPDHENVPSAVFTQPPVGACGLTEEQAVAKGLTVDVFSDTFNPMRNTISGRKEKALMKLIVDTATDRVVGVHLVCPDAAEILQGFGVAMKCGATKAQFDSCIGIHPSAAEELVTMRTAKRRVGPNASGNPKL